MWKRSEITYVKRFEIMKDRYQIIWYLFYYWIKRSERYRQSKTLVTVHSNVFPAPQGFFSNWWEFYLGVASLTNGCDRVCVCVCVLLLRLLQISATVSENKIINGHASALQSELEHSQKVSDETSQRLATTAYDLENLEKIKVRFRTVRAFTCLHVFLCVSLFVCLPAGHAVSFSLFLMIEIITF